MDIPSHGHTDDEHMAPHAYAESFHRRVASALLTGVLATACAASQAGTALLNPDLNASSLAQAPLFRIEPYRANYLLPLTYNFARPDSFTTQGVTHWSHTEVTFQISLKAQITRGLVDGNGAFFIGYTQRSFWQAYNRSESAPFRETNYEPELMWRWYDNLALPEGLRSRLVTVGLVHQSNGQAGALSRSWNRAYADLLFSAGSHTYIDFKPWWRFPEKRKSSATAAGDDNPDIQHYMGRFELRLYHDSGRSGIALMVRNNLSTGDNHGAWQLSYRFPLIAGLQGYLQWFNGYGESLIDYNHMVNRVGIGIILSDWL